MGGFLDVHRHRVLGDIFADQTPVPLDDPSLDWLQPPSQEFMEYARRRPRWPFDENPPDPVNFRENTSFLISQVHRMFITLEALRRNAPADSGSAIVDLGAFPFTLDIAMREYLLLSNPIMATINQDIPEEWRSILAPYRLDLVPANLDPLVAPAEELQGLSDQLPLADHSAGLILFSHAIEHLYHPLMILKEAARILKPGGKIVLTTDNAFLTRGFFSFLGNNEWVHEPVEQTAAMAFNLGTLKTGDSEARRLAEQKLPNRYAWRGHVRFFSAGDLKKLLEASGFTVIETEFREVLYNSFLEEFFFYPTTALPRFLADLLTQFPHFRNEIVMVGEKV